MRKSLILVVALAIIFTVGAMMTVYGGPGAAPNSGDGISDGSGFEVLPGPSGPSGPSGSGASLTAA